MSNKLLRTVKRRKTAIKILREGNVTIFYKRIFGYNLGKMTKGVIANTFFEVYDGIFYGYQHEVKANEEIIRFNPNPELDTANF